jgi:hypothetical protein
LSIIIVHYFGTLAHEYGHATTAWLFGYKKTPFDIYIGNWLLIPVDEAVNYNSLLASGHGIQAALIAISGITVTAFLFLLSLYSLNREQIKKSPFLLSIFYWLAVQSLMVFFQYVPNNTFTIEGDIGRFIHGLNISPLWVFIPGTLLVLLAFYRMYRYETIKMFALLPIKTNIMKRIFLLTTFWMYVELMIYWTPPATFKVLAWSSHIFSTLLVIFILISCDPSRTWVKRNIALMSNGNEKN